MDMTGAEAHVLMASGCGDDSVIWRHRWRLVASSCVFGRTLMRGWRC